MSEAEERWERLLYPVIEDYAQAVCRGHPETLDRLGHRLRELVIADPDPQAGADFVGSLLVYVTGQIWDAYGSGGDADRERPGRLRFADGLQHLQGLLVSLGARHGAAEALMTRGQEALGRGDVRAASELLRQACDQFGRLGDNDALRLRAIAAGMRHRAEGDLSAAIAAFRDGAERSAALALPASQASCLAELAELTQQTGDLAAAASAWAQAARLAAEADLSDRAVSWQICAADAAITAGRAATERNELRQARHLFRIAREGYLAGGQACADAAANSALHLGIMEFSLNERDAAVTWFRTAESEYAALSNHAGLGLVHFAWGNALISRSEVRAAEPLLRAATEELVSTGQREAAGGCLRLLGAAALARGDHQLGQQLLTRAAQLLCDEESKVVLDLATTGWDPFHAAPGNAPDAAQRLADMRRRLLAEGEPGKAAAATLMEVSALLQAGRTDEALRVTTVFDALVAQASADPRSTYLSTVLALLPTMLRAVVATRVDGSQGCEPQLTELHTQLLDAGATVQAARVAVLLAQRALDAGRPQDAADRAVPALLALSALHLTLPNSRERRQWAEVIADAAQVALRAAAREGDRLLLAELVEVLRGQAMPEPVLRPSGATLSLEDLLGSLADDSDPSPSASPPDAATILGTPAGIRMPWGTVALRRYRDAAKVYLGMRGSPVIAPLIVAR